ncbi:TIGR02328 family protein, partial [Lacticaseibacillus paracasei]
QHCPAYKQLNPVALTIPIYPEHDQRYKHVCLTNLQNKGIFLNLP